MHKISLRNEMLHKRKRQIDWWKKQTHDKNEKKKK